MQTASTCNLNPWSSYEYRTLTASGADQLRLEGRTDLNLEKPRILSKKAKLTQRIRYTIAVPLRMLHVVLWINQKVVDHLNRFRMLDVDMLLLTHRLHKVLMDNLSDLAPCVAIVHN